VLGEVPGTPTRRSSFARLTSTRVPARRRDIFHWPCGRTSPSASSATAPAATRQKIRALAERSQTEPRDVFDLDLLFAKFPDAVAKGDVAAETIERATGALFGIEYEAFEALVVNFLEDEYVALYQRREVWEEMVLKVSEALQGLA
jgi:hypothetical protein